MAFANAAWLLPVSTDPSLLVDRDRELDTLVRWLEEHRVGQIREGHILITGARGVGKSIFTRTALRRFEARHPDQAVCITVDSRNIGYRAFLSRFAEHLSDAIRPHAEKGKRHDIVRWLDQLSLLAAHSQITRAQVDTIARRYSADASLGADLLFKLQHKVSWEETRSLGQTVQSTLAVTDELLHAAITATLERLAEADSRWMVVVFFDDLDQAAVRDREEDVTTLFRKVIDLRPCLSIVHFRTDALVGNITREVTEDLYLHPLSPEVLFEIVQRRLEAATEDVQALFPPHTDWSSVKRLAACTGNPLAFLRWVHALLRLHEWPIAPGWAKPSSLLDIALRAALFRGVDPEVVERLVRVVDRCDGGKLDQAVKPEDLMRGTSPFDTSPPEDRLTEREIEHLRNVEVLLPRYRHNLSAGYRIEPTLDLLRPSVRARI